MRHIRLTHPDLDFYIEVTIHARDGRLMATADLAEARLRAPAVPVPARVRARLTKRLEQLRKQHGWGNLDDAEYQAQRDAVRADTRELPDDDRVRSFDAFRTQLLDLPDAIAAASPSWRAELCHIVV